MVINEKPKPVDVIIVLSGDTGRVEYGVKLYQLGYANKLLLTGSTDTEILSGQAQKLGIPTDNIIIENQSFTTFLNAKHSIDIMRSRGFKSAIVVTSPYHTRRASIIFAQFSEGLDIIICSVPYDSSMSSNWWKDKWTAMRVFAEYLKFAWHYLFER